MCGGQQVAVGSHGVRARIGDLGGHQRQPYAYCVRQTPPRAFTAHSAHGHFFVRDFWSYCVTTKNEGSPSISAKGGALAAHGVEMSGQELHERFVQLIRRALVEHDGPPNVIPARVFQQVLNSLGLKLGNPTVDNIMLNCDILENGTVDVSRLLNVSTGANNDTTATVGAMTQAERVHNRSQAIHRAFIEFDSGRMSEQKFIQQLQALGIEQTLESKRVLRQLPVSFSHLLHALTMTDSTDITDKAAGSVRQSTASTAAIMSGAVTPGGPSRRHRGVGSFNGAHDRSTDVVTWKKDQLAINRGLNAKLWNTRAIDYNTDLWKGDVIKDVLIHGQEPPMQRFETEAQHASLTGIGQPDVPLTSAGYQTADKGLIREQLYSLIRQLDQGAITIAAFRQHLNTMGIPVPPRANRHLQQYAANGRVNFKEFVMAFEDYLQDATVHVQEPVRPTTAPVSTEPWWHTGGRGGKHNPQLQRGYGDIITWENTKQGGEARDISREHEKATFGRRLGFLYGGENRQQNFLVRDVCLSIVDDRVSDVFLCFVVVHLWSGLGNQPVQAVRRKPGPSTKQRHHLARTQSTRGGALLRVAQSCSFTVRCCVSWVY